MIKGFLTGLLFCALAALAGAYAFVRFGVMPTHADEPPSKLETWAANKSLGATMRREIDEKQQSPIPADDENLLEGVKLYAANCAVCHGGPDGKMSRVAKGLYQTPPQLAADGVEDDPVADTFWIVRHGVRLTGMPSFSGSLSQNQLWQLTLFLKHMDKLPPAVQKAWKRVPSQAAAGR